MFCARVSGRLRASWLLWVLAFCSGFDGLHTPSKAQASGFRYLPTLRTYLYLGRYPPTSQNSSAKSVFVFARSSQRHPSHFALKIAQRDFWILHCWRLEVKKFNRQSSIIASLGHRHPAILRVAGCRLHQRRPTNTILDNRQIVIKS